jgi:hypothetical protein
MFEVQQRFAYERGFTPVGILYASIRASRRGLVKNPVDASAYYILAQTYASLVRTTSEQSWARRLPQLMRLRQIQASAALNRALTLNPKLGEARVELGRLYLSLNYLDLAAVQLQAYRDTPPDQGGPPKNDPQSEAILAELDRLTDAVSKLKRDFYQDSLKFSVGDRAALAAQRGLCGEALAILLKSDVSAFGVQGMELELELLLQTGRPEDVLTWMTPELRGSLGNFTYFWLRAQAQLALGRYAAADAELDEITGPSNLPIPLVATEVGETFAKTLLDQQPGFSSFPQMAMRTLSEFDFRNRITQTSQKLGRISDVLVVRGLIALEAGTIDYAREFFRAALVYAPKRWGSGQLAFGGRLVAWECLALLDTVKDEPTRPRNE